MKGGAYVEWDCFSAGKFRIRLDHRDRFGNRIGRACDHDLARSIEVGGLNNSLHRVFGGFTAGRGALGLGRCSRFGAKCIDPVIAAHDGSHGALS